MRWGVLLLCCVGCGGKQSPNEAAPERVARAVDVASQHNGGVHQLHVRYNPVAACECPEFEVFAYGGWMRVFVAPTAQVTALTQGDPLAQQRIRGELQQTRLAANGVRYRVLQVTP